MSKLVTIKVPESTRTRAKVYAAENDLAIYEVIGKALDLLPKKS